MLPGTVGASDDSHMGVLDEMGAGDGLSAFLPDIGRRGFCQAPFLDDVLMTEKVLDAGGVVSLRMEGSSREGMSPAFSMKDNDD